MKTQRLRKQAGRSIWMPPSEAWFCRALFCLLVFMAGAAPAGTVTYVYTDPQGTPLAEADAQGNITARFEYTPYGVSVPSMGAAPDGVGYTGHVNDPDTGLVYMQARYYDPSVGWFLSADPVTPAAGNFFNLNRYAYANNNPINHVDPDGRCPDACVVEGGVAISAGAVYLTAGALIAIGACVTACQKIQDAISRAAKSIYDHVVHNESKDSQRPSKTPNEGEPGSKHKNPGSGQEREYGQDGKPTKDIDHDHDHGQGQPHVHDWGRDSNGNPVRGPGRPVNPKTEPHVAPPPPPPPPPPPLRD